jgi:hypothetical protein
MCRDNEESNSDVMPLQAEQNLLITEQNSTIVALPNNSRESR